MGLFIGQAIRRVAGEPESLFAGNRERAQLLQWALYEGTPALWPSKLDLDRPATLDDASRAFDRWLERGEIGPAREALRQLELSDPVGVRRQIARLEAQTRDRRAAAKSERGK